MLNKIAAIILLLASAVGAAETRWYLVKRVYFPTDEFVYEISPYEYKYFRDLGPQNIKEAGGQPFRQTSYQLNYDGKYALWGVTLDEGDKGRINGLANAGKIGLLSSASEVTTWTPQRGPQRDIATQTFGALPTDYYRVDPSTGT